MGEGWDVGCGRLFIIRQGSVSCTSGNYYINTSTATLLAREVLVICLEITISVHLPLLVGKSVFYLVNFGVLTDVLSQG